MRYSKEFKIGLFVVVVLTASFFLINYLRGKDIFNNEIEVSARYGDLEGLVASAPVYIKGYKAGSVSDVSYDSETGDFLVTCSVMKEFMIPEDSRMTIYGVDIMGGKGIRIDLGHSDIAVEDGGYLLPSSEPSLLDGLASGIGPLLEKVTVTLDSLSVTVSGVNRLLDSENQESLSGTLAHLESTMRNVERLSSKIGGRSDELDDFIVNLSALSRNLGSVVSKIDTTMTDVSSVISSVAPTTVTELLDSLQELLMNINDPDGTLSKLLTTDSIYNSVDDLLNDIDSLVSKIQENPKKYLKISVF